MNQHMYNLMGRTNSSLKVAWSNSGGRGPSTDEVVSVDVGSRAVVVP